MRSGDTGTLQLTVNTFNAYQCQYELAYTVVKLTGTVTGNAILKAGNFTNTKYVTA